MTVLLDANVLIALSVPEHVHHEPAMAWFGARTVLFATCPITQGSLVRLLLRQGISAAVAVAALEGITHHPDHEFWADAVPYSAEVLRNAVGHRQVTDCYLAALARGQGGQLATFDRGLAAAHADVATLVPAS